MAERAANLVFSIMGLALALAAPAGAHQPGGEGASVHAHGHAHPPKIPARALVFPDARDGRRILAVDLHTHSVFSDGHVWPTVRTWEAERDGLAALAVTEHLEYQPHRDDIPHPDRNRSYALAKESAERLAERNGTDLIVIPGAEITRRLPPGHVNAVFIKDANPLLTIDKREDDALDNARAALEEAKRQGAFTFWNHPAWRRDFPDGVLQAPREQTRLVKDKLIQGIEVANGDGFSEEALAYALEHDLVILGTSDIHGLIDYDYDIAGGEHRTATLVLTQQRNAEGVERAVKAGDTVALYKGLLIGRPAAVEAVSLGALSLEVGAMGENERQAVLTLRNNAPIAMVLRNVGPKRFQNAGDIVTVPAHGELELRLTAVAPGEPVSLPVEVLNAYVAPGRHLKLTLP